MVVVAVDVVGDVDAAVVTATDVAAVDDVVDVVESALSWQWLVDVTRTSHMTHRTQKYYLKVRIFIIIIIIIISINILFITYCIPPDSIPVHSGDHSGLNSGMAPFRRN